MRRRRRSGDHLAGHADRWLVSYADFITLLFAFFVTMYAISNVDARKMAQLVVALQAAFAEPSGAAGPSGAGAHGRIIEPAGPDLPAEERLFYRLRAIGEDRVEFGRDRRGFVITVKEAGTFATGRADLDAPARVLFWEIGRSLADLPHAIRVEGHTDDRPIHTGRFSSNWELSTARATTVVAFLIEAVGLPPSRLSAAGYGEFHPRLANDSEEHRARNRRVDIIVLNARTERSEEPRAGNPDRP